MADLRHPKLKAGCTRPPRQTIKSVIAMQEPSTQDIRVRKIMA
jgi:hypothetical protein